MRVTLTTTTRLRFEDGSPVRAASAIARLGDGWLVAQDDATHGCWWRRGTGTRMRLLPAVEGLDVFGEIEGTKHHKPDLEAACDVGPGVLLLGSGSTPARMRSVLMDHHDRTPRVRDLSAGYAALADALGVPADGLNLEGACVLGDRLRWFQRGLPAAGLPTGWVDVVLADLLDGRVRVVEVATLDLGPDLAITDAVALADGRVLVSAVAEASTSTYDDGPVTGSALALLDGDRVLDVTELPLVGTRVAKVEGLAVLDQDDAGLRLLASVDSDDPEAASLLLGLDVGLGAPGQ